MTKKANEQVKDADLAQGTGEAIKAAPMVDSPTMLNFEEEIGDSVESKLRVKPCPEFDNLIQVILSKVEFDWKQAKELDENGVQSTYEYAGLKLPNLHLEFTQVPSVSSPKERFLDLYFSPYANRKNDGTAIDPDSIIKHYRWEYEKLRHIANAFVKNANYQAIPIPAFNYAAEPNVRVKQLGDYYAAWAALLTGKKEGAFASQINWMKVVADSRKGTYFTVPDYVNEGFIERVVEGKAPSIEVKVNDVIVLKAAKSEKGADKKAGVPAKTDAPQVSEEVNDILSKYTTKK